MGKARLVARLVTRDLRRRPGQAVLLLAAITAATAILSLGLALHGVDSHPYQQTQAATNGPDVVARIGGPDAPGGPGGAPGNGPAPIAQARSLAAAPGVTGYSGPYLLTSVTLRVRGLGALAQIQGRSTAPAAVDQPDVTAGHWVSPGGVVLERTFAEALGVRVGDRVTLNGQSYRVVGLAVTAASTPYPNMCESICTVNGPPDPPRGSGRLGAGWVTEADARALAARDQLPASYVVNLRLKDPAQAQAFAFRYGGGNSPSPAAPLMVPWQAIAKGDALLITDQQQVLSIGAWLTGVLAVASVAVLAGGRMTEQARRVGLLKAAGGTPGLVASVLLAENLVVALAAAGAGLLIAWLAAPLITSPGAGLIGTAGAPSLTLSTAVAAVAAALGVALAGTLVPAERAARSSTVQALAMGVGGIAFGITAFGGVGPGSTGTRPPRRRATLITLSAQLPVPVLLGLRLVGRRPRRALLGAASIAVTVTGLVAVVAFHTMVGGQRFGGDGLSDPVVNRDQQMLLVLTVALVALAVLNAVFTAWATALDARLSSALTRALGATPQQVGAGLAAAQMLPALAGALVGIPLGILLFTAASGTGQTAIPSASWLAAVVAATLAAVALLTGVVACFGDRRPAAEVLGSETA